MWLHSCWNFEKRSEQPVKCDTEHDGSIAREALRERPGGNIAYQVVGDGPVDLVIVPGWLSHVDLMWGDPGWAERIPELGIDVRGALHTGECERRGDDLGGIAVHIGARIAATAQAKEVLVSSTVKDLVNGSGIVFQDRGAHALKGVAGEWRLFAPIGEHESIEEHLAAVRMPAQDPLADRVARHPRVARMLGQMAHRN
jgi:hypothetical protein